MKDKKQKLKRIYGFLAKITEVDTKRPQRNITKYAIDSSRMINNHAIRKHIEKAREDAPAEQAAPAPAEQADEEKWIDDRQELEHRSFSKLSDAVLNTLFPTTEFSSRPVALTNGLDRFEVIESRNGSLSLNTGFLSGADEQQIIDNFQYYVDQGYNIYEIADTVNKKHGKIEMKYNTPGSFKTHVLSANARPKTKAKFLAKILQRRIVAVKRRT